jgi:transcription termination factor 2
LPSKTVEEFYVTLNKEEKFIYTRVMMYSKSIFANYLQQQMDKASSYDYDKNRLGRVYDRMAQKFQVNHEIKTHEILVLLLRMRQACCHPGLLQSMLEGGDLNTGEDESAHHEDGEESVGDLMQQIEKLKLNEDSDDVSSRWSLDNPVFSLDRPSSKIEHMMNVLREKVLPTDDKAIIVSQWTSYLNVVRGMLEIEGVSYCELNGTVLVKNRNDIVQNFNDPRSGIRVMLLSLTAGGVGLNLVGANYLLLMDLHWNPQLEQQAMDRIYRFGQKKDVKIFK